MSNYAQRMNSNLLVGRNSGIADFSETVTDPKISMTMMRLSVYNSGGPSKRRPFAMYMKLRRLSKSQPDMDVELNYRYANIAENIIAPFISDDCAYVSPLNLEYILQKIRFNVYKELTDLTGCGKVNIIFKKEAGIDEGISTFITNTDITSDTKSNMSIGAFGVQFSSNTTLTLMIPIEFIQTTINTLITQAKNNVKKNANLDNRDSDMYIRSELISLVRDAVGRIVNKSLYAGLYKELIFNTFTNDVYDVVKAIDSKSVSSASYKTVSDITRKSNAYKYTTFLNMGTLTEFVRSTDISKMNPHSILDLFDISNVEIDKCLSQLINEKYHIDIDVTPRYFNLNLDPDDYLDEMSLAIANSLFINKLSTIVTTLVILTRESILPSSRKKYVELINGNLSIVERLTTNDITHSISDILLTVKYQMKELTKLSKNVVKLNKVIFNGHTTV